MSGICTDYITIPLSVISGCLLIISELLGMRNDKDNKCTSVIQAISAGFWWMYLKLRRAWRYMCSCGRRYTPSDPSTETLDAVSAEVSRNVTIGHAFPTWRQRKRPTAEPPGITIQSTATVIQQHLEEMFSGDHMVVVISRPPSRASRESHEAHAGATGAAGATVLTENHDNPSQ